MLQSCGVENHLRFSFKEDITQVFSLTNIRENNTLIIQAGLASDRELCFHQQGFVTIEHHEQLRVVFVDLTA